MKFGAVLYKVESNFVRTLGNHPSSSHLPIFLLQQLSLSPCMFLSTNSTTLHTSSKTSGHPVLWLGDSLASSFTIFGALYPSCQRLTISLLFVLTVQNHDTFNRSINSPLPKRLKHIITHSHNSSNQLNNRLNKITQTSYELLHNFVQTSP